MRRSAALAELRESLSELSRRSLGKWWAITTTGVGGMITLINYAVPQNRLSFLVPRQVWPLAMLLALGAALSLTFHEVRLERDRERRDKEERFSAVRYSLQMQQLQGDIARERDGNWAYYFRLVFRNGGVEPLEFEITQIQIIVAGNTAPPESKFLSTRGLILPGNTYSFLYHRIPVASVRPVPGRGHIWDPSTPPEPQAGQGEYKIVYGHPSGGPKFLMSHKFAIYWRFLPGQGWEAQWTDVGDITHEPAPGDP